MLTYNWAVPRPVGRVSLTCSLRYHYALRAISKLKGILTLNQSFVDHRIMPRLEDWEIKKYWEIFQGLGPTDNKLTGERVSPVLKNSRLRDDQLSKIWELSDIDADGRLDFEEFCITMRLIFDLVNGSVQSVPEELPEWLIPSSKAHLVEANRTVSLGRNLNMGDDYEDDDTLSDDFDWYISPTDKSTYETVYNSNSDSYGRVRFESLGGLYDTLSNVSQSDISSAWNLVNPKSFETIDKDQVLVFLHILNQRENGKRIPRGVPPSLRATFSKEQPNYDINSVTNTKAMPPASSKKSFASSYLSKIGHTSSRSEKGTDFSATEGTDWEEVRLRRELKELEDRLAKAQKDEDINEEVNKSASSKYEYEQLLKFKEQKLKSVELTSGPGSNLKDIKEDIELIETQAGTLEEFLDQKKNELNKISAEIKALQG